MSVLVVAEHDNAKLAPATFNTIQAGNTIRAGLESAGLSVLVAGHDCRAVADEAAKVDGVSRILYADHQDLAHPLAEVIAGQVIGQCDGFSHLLAPASTFGKNMMPRVAAMLDVAQISDIVGIESEDIFVRPIYAGNVLETVKSIDPLKVITVRATAFEPAPLADRKADIVEIEASGNTGISTFIGNRISQSERPELTSARVIVAGGRGMQSAENFAMLETLADRLDAAIGASRAAVDAGYVSNDHQIGQTGKIVAPELYIAIGISGAIQHLAGMKCSKVIVAINKDADAPIFQVADYGLVADLFSVLPELTEELS